MIAEMPSWRVFEIESSDLGATRGTLTLGTLPNPNSGTDTVTLNDGRHLIVYIMCREFVVVRAAGVHRSTWEASAGETRGD